VREKTGTIHVKWVRSGIGLPRRQKEIVASLGLQRLNQVVERPDNPSVRGIVAKVPHLLKVVPAPASPSWAAVTEYVIVAPVAAPKPRAAAPKRVKESSKETAAKAASEVKTQATAADAAPQEKAKASKKRVSAAAKEAASVKGEAAKPRKRKAAAEKETKPPKKGKK